MMAFTLIKLILYKKKKERKKKKVAAVKCCGEGFAAARAVERARKE
jgi:hypothetical protein